MLKEWVRRIRSLVCGGREDAEMQAELRFHLDMETEKNLAAGMDAREARQQAHRRLGGMIPIQEAVRDARGVRPLSDLLRDFGLTVRSLRRSPLFTVVTVATLPLDCAVASWPARASERPASQRRLPPACSMR